jgi:hypothetical protein
MEGKKDDCHSTRKQKETRVGNTQRMVENQEKKEKVDGQTLQVEEM